MARDAEAAIRLVWFLFQLAALLFSFLVLPFVIAERKALRERQAVAMSSRARALVLRFSGVPNAQLNGTMKHLEKLDVGVRNRYAFIVVAGDFDGHPVVLFDYHYATSGAWWWSPSWRIPNYVCIAMVQLEKDFPELTIGPESGGLFAAIADAFGGGDIDFESHEFSERFDVRSNDKKFAYDFCNAQMIEYLLANGQMSIEVEQSSLAMGFRDMHDVNRIKSRLKRLVEIRNLMPNYLFAGAHG